MSDPVGIAVISAISANTLALIGAWVVLRQTHKAVNSERTSSLAEIKRLREELAAANHLQAMTEAAANIPVVEDKQ